MVFDPKLPNDSNLTTTTDYNQGYDEGHSDGFEEGAAFEGTRLDNGVNGKEPLGLPRGSVRSIIALELITSLIGLTAYLVATNPEIGKIALGTLTTLAVAVGTWYFATRVSVQK